MLDPFYHLIQHLNTINYYILQFIITKSITQNENIFQTYRQQQLETIVGWTEGSAMGSAVGISVGSVVGTISITLKTYKNVKNG